MSRAFAIIAFVLALLGGSRAYADSDVSNSTNASASNASGQILPGFVSIRRSGNSLELYERSYSWGSTFFPVIRSRSEIILSSLELVVRENGIDHVLSPVVANWMEESSTKVVFSANGETSSIIAKAVLTIEYDGVIDIRLSLNPAKVNHIEKISLVGKVPKKRRTVVIGFSADKIRQQKNRDDVIQLPHEGRFLNAFSIGDGERALWWFADSRHGWIGPEKESTSLFETSNEITFVVTLVSTLSGAFVSPTDIRFGLLGTPVKEIHAEQLRERISIGRPSKKEKSLGAKYKLWWPTAFAYDAYPYTTYQGNDAQMMAPEDVRSYPGLAKNRKLVSDDYRAFGVHWIPYFSAHVLSEIDPGLRQHRSEWLASPVKVFRDGLSPYTSKFDKPVLSHNAPGYSEYLVSRVSDAVGQIGARGIYLDHGPPVDSSSPSSGGWQNASGHWQPALDIFALRGFLKRLSEALTKSDEEAVIFVHSSNREIIPALTFAHAIVDGEQYRADVKDGRYLDLVSLDEFRARFSSRQSGILTYLIPGDWYVNREDKAWVGSQKQLIAFRRAIGLALLHATGIWPQGAPPGERERLFGLIDRNELSDASFIGYWRGRSFLELSQPGLPVSLYVNKNRVVAIILNTTGQEQSIRISVSGAPSECRDVTFVKQWSDKVAEEAGGQMARIAPQDFAMATYKSSAACTASLIE